MEVSLQAHRPLSCRTVFQDRRTNLKLKPVTGFCPHGRVSHFSPQIIHLCLFSRLYQFSSMHFGVSIFTLSYLVLILIKIHLIMCLVGSVFWVCWSASNLVTWFGLFDWKFCGKCETLLMKLLFNGGVFCIWFTVL